jgi:hypothetical protein
MMSTAIAELQAPTAVGSGDWLDDLDIEDVVSMAHYARPFRLVEAFVQGW